MEVIIKYWIVKICYTEKLGVLENVLILWIVRGNERLVLFAKCFSIQ